MDIDFHALCRLCAKRYELSIDVLSKSESHNTFAHLIQEFFSVIIQAHDGLPSRICFSCKSRLETWAQIREDVAEAQEYLTQCMLRQTGILQQDEGQVLSAADPDLTIWRVDSTMSVPRNLTEEQQQLHPECLDHELPSTIQPIQSPPWLLTTTPPPPHIARPHSVDDEDTVDLSTEDSNDTCISGTSKESKKLTKKVTNELMCNICDKVFARKDNLRQHMIIHSGEKSFRCDKCPQSFTRASDLKVHYRIHTAEKPLQCHFCSQLFRESSNFKKHLRTHSGDRPFKCNICNKHFAQSPHLKRHLRIHSGERPYRCEVCSRQFSQSSTLRTHERTHSGLKPHTCNICSRSFRHTSTLKAHARTHTGEKAFYCDKCPKSFFWRTSFDCHVLTHQDD